MGVIDARGLSAAQATPLGKGAIQHAAAGTTSVVSDLKARSNADIAGYGIAEATATPLANLVQLVKVSSVTVPAAGRVRVTFDRPMANNAALRLASSYSFTTVTPGAAALTFLSAEKGPGSQPTYVDLLTSEHTTGASYSVEALSPGATDPEGTPTDPSANSGGFTGVGVAPTLSSVQSISENRVDVIFNEPMTDNADIRNPAKYNFDGGLSVLSVLEVDSDTVKLVTSDQTPGTLYTLTVTP